ncbi:MAG: 16S rRNA processing protein RimM [Chloroflexi bacterium]|nr:16S rRNA processing protein RimM [Chloroflexota bacterium]
MNGSDPIAVGEILGTHGLWGAVRARVLSDVANRFDAGGEIHISGISYRIAKSSSIRTRQVILQLHGVNTYEAAKALVGYMITVPPEAVPQLPEGEYFHFQLLGIKVLTEEGEELGRISDILETGSNDVYVVNGPTGEVLVPALADVIVKVDLDQGIMEVNLPDGLR